MNGSDLACAILAYLVDHPDAQDSIEGIEKWWRLQQSVPQQVIVLRKALRKLAKEGLVHEIRNADTHTYFQINSNKHEDINAFMTKHRVRRDSD
jgi:hypothetical protein